MRIRRIDDALELRQNAPSVDLPGWRLPTRHLDDGGKDIDGHAGGVARRASRNHGGIPHDEGNSNAPFKGRSLAFPKTPGGTRMISVVEPRPVVTREDEDRLVENPLFGQRRDDLADRPVDFLDHIGIWPVLRGLTEPGPDPERNMRHRVRHVEQKRLIGMAMHEVHRMIRESLRDHLLVVEVVDEFDRPVIAVPRKPRPRLRALRMTRPHVVGIRNPRVLVETLSSREEGLAVTEMPLAVTGGGVTQRLHHFGDRVLIRVEPELRAGNQRPVDAQSVRVTPRQERRPRRGADRLRDVEIREPHPLLSESIDVRASGCPSIRSRRDPPSPDHR